MRNFISRTSKELRIIKKPQRPIPALGICGQLWEAAPTERLYDRRVALWFRTTLMQPSCRSRNLLYESGPSSRPPVCVTTNDGSIWPCMIRKVPRRGTSQGTRSPARMFAGEGETNVADLAVRKKCGERLA